MNLAVFFIVSIRTIVLGLSAFSIGLALYLAFLNLRDWSRHVPYAWGYAFSRLGYAIVVGLIGEQVARQPFIPGSWRAWGYVVGLSLAGTGFIGIIRDHRRVNPPESKAGG